MFAREQALSRLRTGRRCSGNKRIVIADVESKFSAVSHAVNGNGITENVVSFLFRNNAFTDGNRLLRRVRFDPYDGKLRAFSRRIRNGRNFYRRTASALYTRKHGQIVKHGHCRTESVEDWLVSRRFCRKRQIVLLGGDTVKHEIHIDHRYGNGIAVFKKDLGQIGSRTFCLLRGNETFGRLVERGKHLFASALIVCHDVQDVSVPLQP